VLAESGTLSTPSGLLLDIGTGNGEIAALLGEEFKVVSVGVRDLRSCTGGYGFVRCAEALPFPDGIFDVVVSNHVIEHVGDARAHVREVARVLKLTGVAYLATPNRLWPWEVHNKVPLLHYLPHAVFHWVLRRLGKYREDVRLLSWPALRRLAGPFFRIAVWSDRVCRRPADYELEVPEPLRRLLGYLPLWLYTACTLLHPTLILLLTKRQPPVAGA
jgi:SAM-dependent methyltransferase